MSKPHCVSCHEDKMSTEMKSFTKNRFNLILHFTVITVIMKGLLSAILISCLFEKHFLLALFSMFTLNFWMCSILS